MKKVPVKVFYVEFFLYRFDVYPNRISPLLQLRKDGHLYGNRHADYETVIANFPGIVILNLISYITKLGFSL